MADAQSNLQIVITSNTAQAQEGLQQFDGSLGKLGEAATALGLGLLAQQIAQIGERAITAAMDFQSSMLLIQTQAMASHNEVVNMSKAVLDLAGQVATAPEQLAQGLYHIESAGLRGAQALDVLKIAAEGARVGGANLEDVTNALVAAVVSGIPGVQNMSQAMGMLDAIVGSGNMRMEDLAVSMSSGILPVAKTFGMSLQDVGAALATLTDNGVPAQEAATRLRMEFSLLAAPSKAAQDALAGIGLSSRALADDMRSGGIVKAMEDLRNHLKASGKDATEMSQTLSEAFGGGRSSSGIMTLVDQIDRLKQKYDVINGASKTFGDRWKETSQSASVQFQQLQANFETLGIKIATVLLPPLTKALEFINAHQTVLIAFAGILAGVFTVAIIGATVAFIALIAPIMALAVTIAGITAPVWAVGLAIIAVVATIVTAAGVIITHFQQIRQTVQMVAMNISTLWKQHSDLILSIMQTFSNVFTGNWLGLWQQVFNVFTSHINQIKGIIQDFANWAGGIINGIIGGIHSAASAISSVGNIGHKALGGTASGMTLVGERGPELVNLPTGSYVHTAEQTKGMQQGGATININNPVVRSDSDIRAIVQQVQQALGRQYELARLGAI